MLDPVRFTHTLTAALPHVPLALIDEAARMRLAAIAASFPAALTRRAYLECRLAQAASRVDIVICVDADSRVLLAQPPGRWAGELSGAPPLWAGLGRLCARWADPRSALHACVYDLWLEFDAEGRAGGVDGQLPGLFIGFRRGVPAPVALDAAFEGLAIVSGRPVDPQVAHLAQCAIRALPAGTSLPYVGVMYPRDTRAVRLCVTPMAGASLSTYLAAIGWPGPVDELAALLASLPCGGGRCALDAATLLHVDLLDTVQPRVGVEIPLPQVPQIHDGLGDSSLLDALCARGLCLPSKRDALQRWPGFSVERFPHECWPSLALRRVSHVKIVYEAGRLPEAKTYLSFFHHYSKGGTRRRHAAADAARRPM